MSPRKIGRPKSVWASRAAFALARNFAQVRAAHPYASIASNLSE